MNRIAPIANVFNFYAQNLNTNQIYSTQKGTTRTNCLDNLDRTNVIQTRISWLVLENMFKFLKIDTLNLKFIFNDKENFFTIVMNLRKNSKIYGRKTAIEYQSNTPVLHRP